METLIIIAIIGVAALWFIGWLRKSLKGDGGCACSGCKKECGSRQSTGKGSFE